MGPNDLEAVKQGLQSHGSLLTPESMQRHQMQSESGASRPSKNEAPSQRRLS